MILFSKLHVSETVLRIIHIWHEAVSLCLMAKGESLVNIVSVFLRYFKRTVKILDDRSVHRIVGR